MARGRRAPARIDPEVCEAAGGEAARATIVAEAPAAGWHIERSTQYPLVLTTGRVLYHWHRGEMTRRARQLVALYPEALVEVSPEDAARIGLGGNTKVRLRSRRCEMVAQAIVTDRVTIAALDPVAKIPEYKVCAVQMEAAVPV